jgi:uncharacterized membrane protein
MKPLAVLIISFILSLLSFKIFKNNWDYILSANVAMSSMLVFTAIGHFLYSKGMAMMIPNFIPFKTELVLISGLFELVTPIGLLIPRFQHDASMLVIIATLFITSCSNNSQELNSKVAALQDSVTSLQNTVQQLKRSDSLNIISIVDQRQAIKNIREEIKHISVSANQSGSRHGQPKSSWDKAETLMRRQY